MTEQHYYYGTGKRKTSVAEVRLYPGGGGFTVNERRWRSSFPFQRGAPRSRSRFE